MRIKEKEEGKRREKEDGRQETGNKRRERVCKGKKKGKERRR